MARRRRDDVIVAAMRWAIPVIAFGNFVIGTGVMVVGGMLPPLADGLDVTIPVAAQLITGMAIAMALGAPVLGMLTARFDRRRLLTIALLVYAAGHLACALAPGYATLLGLRILLAASPAIFTPQASAALALIIPPEKRGRAVAFALLGWALASVLGMPIGAYVGAVFGWRAGFGLVAVLALVAAIGVRLVLPAGLSISMSGRSIWGELLRWPALQLAIAVTAIQAAGQFTVMAFFVPALQSFLGAEPALVSLLLVLFGVMGFAGALVSARFMDSAGPVPVFHASLALIALGMLLWPLGNGSLAWVVVSMSLWGLGAFATNNAQQARLIAAAPPLASVTIALNTSGMYIGQAIGTPLGAALLSAPPQAADYAWLALYGLPIIALAFAVSFRARQLGERRATPRRPSQESP
ncbi:MAG: MFS transporter [Gemmatimonadales bacterium]|nr:MFS transporter [Gemmatimonadales bacterium]